MCLLMCACKDRCCKWSFATAGPCNSWCKQVLMYSFFTRVALHPPFVPFYSALHKAGNGKKRLWKVEFSQSKQRWYYIYFSLHFPFSPLFLVQSGKIILLGLIFPIHSCRWERLRSRTQICSSEIETHAFMCYARNMIHTFRQKSHLFLTVYVLVVCNSSNAGTTSI